MAKKKAVARPKAKAKAPRKAKSKPAKSKGPGVSLNGWITHTELVSKNPDALKTWCAKALGWKFRPSFPMQDGSMYHLFVYSEMGGGGIRVKSPAEAPGSIPYVQVASVRAAYAKSLKAGAAEMMAPEMIAEDLWIAIVCAPGDVPIGLAGKK